MTTASQPLSVDVLIRSLLTADSGNIAPLLNAARGLDTGEADRLIRRLVDEAERLIGIDPRRMLDVAVAAVTIAEQANEPFLWALARMREGEAMRFLGRNADACAALDEAAQTFLRLDRLVEAARTRVNWIWAAAALGRLPEALRAARSARRVLLRHGLTMRVAGLDNNTGTLLLEHGRLREALRCFTEALARFRTLGSAGDLGVFRSHANRGLAFTRLGRHREALAELEIALAGYIQLDESAGYARVIQRIGENRMALGHYAAAQKAYAEAHISLRRLGANADAAVAARMLADCYLQLNRPADALRALDDAAADLAGTDNTIEALAAATRRVTAQLQLGQIDRARVTLDDAERYVAGAPHHRAWLASQRAELLLLDDPREAFALARTAQRLARSAGTSRLVAEASVIQGEALLALGLPDEAARAARRALRIAAEAAAAPALRHVHELLGRIDEARGRGARASFHYNAAIVQLEREQCGVIFAYRDSFAANRFGSYERLAALQLAGGDPAGALATAERAKSRALVDAVSGTIELRPRGVGSRGLVRKLAAAREEYATAFSMASRHGNAGDSLHPIESAVPELARLEIRVSDAIQELQLSAARDDVPDLDLLGQPATMPPDVPAGAALIEFFSSGDDLIWFVVDGHGVRGGIQPGAVSETARLLRALRSNLQVAEADGAAGAGRLAAQALTILARLYDRLIGGLPELAAYRSLVIVPHGNLHYLPFHALYDGAQHLVERFDVSYAPSATVYSLCRRRRVRRRGRSLVLGHSASGRLPFTLDEAAEVSALLGVPAWIEGEATRARLMGVEAQRARVIHIAAHGEFRGEAPLFSYLALDDGPLTAVDVFGLRFDGGLAVLSGCETARTEIGGGDELIGLSRAFIYAGASGVVVSQWRVGDADTAMLMNRFYRELLGGAEAAAALCAAQRTVLSRVRPGETAPIHPAMWAGFQFVGASSSKRPPRARRRAANDRSEGGA